MSNDNKNFDHGLKFFFHLTKRIATGEIQHDVVIEVEGEQFEVHKLILSTWSSYFARMFSSDFSESTKKYIKLNCVSRTTFRKIISYMYSGKLDLTEKTIGDLVEASSFFLMDDLQSICCDYIKDHADCTNILDLMKMAEMYGPKHLIDWCYSFCVRNFENISQLKEFNYFSLEDLTKIISLNSIPCSEEYIYTIIRNWILFDLENRRRTMSNLIKLLCLHRMDQNFLANKVRNDELIFNNFEAVKCVNEAIHDFSKRNIRSFRVVGRNVVYFHRSSSILCVAGGFIDKSPTNVCRIYNPICESWTEKPHISVSRGNIGMTSIKGKVYAIGGCNGGRAFKTCEVYCPENNKWQLIPDMIKPRYAHGICSLNDCIYVAGGSDGNQILSSVERYDYVAGKWTFMKSMLTPQISVAMTSYNGSLYKVGGLLNGITSDLQQCDPRVGIWLNLPKTSNSRQSCGIVVYKDSMYSCGGSNRRSSQSNFAERYDFRAGRWEILPEMNSGRYCNALIELGGYLYAVGGDTSCTIEKYDINESKWSYINPMPSIVEEFGSADMSFG